MWWQTRSAEALGLGLVQLQTTDRPSSLGCPTRVPRRILETRVRPAISASRGPVHVGKGHELKERQHRRF